MAATMHDVARLAGVSVKSVSNYFNDYPYMTAGMRSRIEEAIETLNYRMNISARNLRSGRTGNIALVIPELNQAYFAELAQSVISAAQTHGLNVFVETTDGDRGHELEILAGNRGPFVDGVIFGPLALGADELRSAPKADFPLVLIGDRVREGTTDFVTMANAAGARAAVAHLIDRGRKRIVALGADDSPAPSAPALRKAGYLEALAAAGIPADPGLFAAPSGTWQRPAGAEAMQAFLARGVPFDAVFGFNDALALGAIHVLHETGIRVPDDVAVVGFDDTEDARFSSPSLTTIDPGRDRIASEAVELLVKRMATPASADGHRTLVADFSLVVRRST